MAMLSEFKRNLRRFTPASLRRAWSDRRDIRNHGEAAPLGHVFARIYTESLWGEADGFYSGPGSAPEYTTGFVRVVNDLIETHGLTSVVDVGCGDFRVGQRIARPGLDYTGVDIFDGLVEQNTRRHGSDQVRFLCMDATKDQLPAADLCVIREVLQHLTNAQIAAILRQLPRFKYAVIAEAQPAPGRMKQPNLDKRGAGETRLFFDSAVRLDAPPFSLSGVEVADRNVYEHWLVAPGEAVVTYVIKTA